MAEVEKLGVGRFGGSLKVDSVQALAEKVRSEIPERYVRPERVGEVVVNGDNELVSGESIPVIDFGRLFDPDTSEEENAKLHSVCQDWGFFMLVNHGISDDIISNLKQDLANFFKHPLEEREKYAQIPGQIEGYGQTFIHSHDQKLDWGDTLSIVTFPPTLKVLRYWPTDPPSCRKTIEEYANGVKRVADALVKLMSKNLGPEFEKIYDMFKMGIQSMRFNYYPPCPYPDKVYGLSPHSDAVALTVLLQMNEKQGLQLRRDNGWLPVKAPPGVFIVNIGDVIEILCNGRYKSIEHRAVVNDDKERLSVAGFHLLNIGDVVGPIPEAVKGEKVLYKSMLFEDYLTKLFASKMEGKNILEAMKLEE